MAVTAEGRAATEAHRRLQGRLARLTVVQMRQLWRLIDLDDIDGTVQGWLSATSDLVRRQHAVSVGIAERYYRRFRTAEVGEPLLGPLPRPGLSEQAVRTSLLVTGPYRIWALLGKGGTLGDAARTAFTTSTAAATRHVLNGGREFIGGAVAQDSRALGWIRVTRGDPCAFYAMLASRGPVFKSRGSAVAGSVFSERVMDFRAHDACGCTAEPVYRSDTEWPGRAREFHDLWNRAQQKARSDPEWASSGTKNDALNNFRKLLERGSSGDS